MADSLRTAGTVVGLSTLLLELVRRGFDAWQKRQQVAVDQRQQTSKAQADAGLALRAYMERQMDDLRDQVRRLADESRRHIQRIEEMERQEARVNAAMIQFLTVVTMLLPDMPEIVQRRVQNALDRVRQVSGLG